MTESRRVGEQERLLHYVHGFGGIIAMQVLHIEGHIEHDTLRRALAWLQRQHPILRAHIRYGEVVFRKLPPFVYRQPYFETEGTSEIPLRIIDGDWEKVLAADLKRPLPRGRMPRIRFALVRDEGPIEHLVMCADHTTLDAQSANMIARQLLAYLADPSELEQLVPRHQQLPPPIEAVLPKKPDSGKGYEPIIRLPLPRVPGGRNATALVERRFGANETAILKQAIKANRATLHGAISAAFLIALREKYGTEEMTILSSVDLRRLGRPPLPMDTYGCFIDILRTRHSTAGAFWDIARDASFKLITAIAKDQQSASIMKLPDWQTYRIEGWPIATSGRRLDGLAITTAGDSGLHSQYGPYRLASVSMAVSLDMFGPALLAIGSEREGAIDLSVNYFAARLSAADANALTDHVMALLSEVSATETAVKVPA